MNDLTNLPKHPKLVLLSGMPMRADLDAAPVGAYDLVRNDIREISTVKPVDRIYVERTERGYRGILYSHEHPHMFVMNSNGFVAKKVDDTDAAFQYAQQLEDAEQKLTAHVDEKRAESEQTSIALWSNEHSTDAPVREPGPPAMVVDHGPLIDTVERNPGGYRSRQDKVKVECCGGGVVIDQDGKVLLVKPKDGYGDYDWTFPKGYPVADEISVATARREVREESGYGAKPKRKLGRFKHNDGGVCEYFEMSADSRKAPAEFDKEETEQVKWVSFLEALELLNDSVDVDIIAQAYRQVPKLVYKGDHTGTMVALHLPLKLAKKLAVKGGESAKTLHITLAYLGKTLTPEQKEHVRDVVRHISRTSGTIKAKLGGVGRFSASSSSEGRDVVYLSVDSPDISRIQPRIVAMLEEAGLPIAKDHGFTPHVTLKYVKPEEKAPVERFPPMDLEFNTIAMTSADKVTAFPLTKLMLKAERNVKTPGKRGGKFWIDEHNQVRYDEKPSAEFHGRTATPSSPVTPNAPPSWKVVKSTPLGLKFRKKPPYEAGNTEKAVLKNGEASASFMQGELEIIATALAKTKISSWEQFFKKHVEPVWDDEDGANKYTVGKARAWMVGVIDFLERDGVLSSGSKETSGIRSPVATEDWDVLSKSLDDLPKFKRRHEWRNGKKPNYASTNGTKIRQIARRILKKSGIDHQYTNRNWAGDNVAALDAKTGQMLHGLLDFDGNMGLSPTVITNLKSLSAKLANDETHLTQDETNSLGTLVHEELHGMSNVTNMAIEGVGLLIEEACTEIVARRIVRDLVGNKISVDFSSKGIESKKPVKFRPRHNITEEGPYGTYIQGVVNAIAHIMATTKQQQEPNRFVSQDEVTDDAKRILEDACLEMKRRVRTAATSGVEHLANFLDCFEHSLSFQERSKLADRLIAFTKVADMIETSGVTA